MTKYFIFAVCGLISCVSLFAYAEEPTLTVQNDSQVKKWTRSALLKSAHVKKILVESDPSYGGKPKTYLHAVPAADLFQGKKIDPTSTIEFTCLDGFSGPMDMNLLLNTDPSKSIAYIAIEAKNEKWAPVKPTEPLTPAPFYLIWDNPKKSGIAIEQWPFQLAGFTVKPSIEAQFPHTVPEASIASGDPVRLGYKTFMKNCFACHTMNGEGHSQLGPDLNLPMNPTEYLQPGRIEVLVRNPQNLRFWPQSKMSHFDKAALSDEELQQVIVYLKYMSTHKATLSDQQKASVGL